MKYQSVAEFDEEDVRDEKTMAERFCFSDYGNKFSYNQAVFLMGNRLRSVAAHKLKVVGRLKDKEYNLYIGSNCFYDWFLNEDADSFRAFDLINFYDEENGKIYQLDRIKWDGEYRYYVSV